MKSLYALFASKATRRRLWVCAAVLLVNIDTVAAGADEADVEALLERIEALEERIRQLEAARDQRDETSPAGEARKLVVLQPADDAEGMEIAEERLGEAVSGSERAVVVEEDELPEPEIHLGGALRFNLVHRDFVRASESKLGESGLDVFRLNVDGQLDSILVSAEYRFYSYMNTLHHGWLGYEFEDESQVQFGIHRVPFGLLPYAAHNVWFGVPYYVGLADDYDMGVKYVRQDGPWSTHLAFYKNEELNDSTDPDRYSFDLLRAGDQQNEEVNQFNGRVAYTLGAGTDCKTELGISGQASDIYNATTDRDGDHWAAAAHMDSRCGRWNVQLQGIHYEYDPANPAGVSRDSVRVGAFAGGYRIAAEGDIVVANLAYNFQSPWESIDQITCYNDYSRLFKELDGAQDSQINTLGCAVGSGPLFTYIDWIYANNMAFFGDGSMAGDGADDWRSRFNVNVGFYW